MHVGAKTISELEFERYLNSHGLENWEFEPVITGKAQRPDYRLHIDSDDLFFEVKEFHQDPKQELPQGGSYDAYAQIREKINAAWEKFRNFKEHCCSLVLFNVDALLVDLDNFTIMMGSMLGDLGMTFPVAVQAGTTVAEPTWTFLKRGKMIDHKRRQPQNTTISALITLSTLALGRRRFEIELGRKERELGRTLEKDEFLRFADYVRTIGLDIAEGVLRVVVYENPYARISLPRGLFVGLYDERYGPDKGRIARVFAGAEIIKLESMATTTSKG